MTPNLSFADQVIYMRDEMLGPERYWWRVGLDKSDEPSNFGHEVSKGRGQHFSGPYPRHLGSQKPIHEFAKRYIASHWFDTDGTLANPLPEPCCSVAISAGENPNFEVETALLNERDGARTRNHRIDSPVL
jgi:hypothetical protein